MKVALVFAPWFKVWNEWEEVVCSLSDEEAGKLFKGMFQYSTNDIEPNLADKTTKLVWLMMKNRLRLDKMKYINQVEHNRKAGKESAKKRKKAIPKKDENSPTANADGTRDRQQVLTSVNEEKKKEERRKEERRKKRRSEENGLLAIVKANELDKETDKEFITSQRAVNVLQKLGEKLSLPKMKVVSKFIREHENMNDDEIASSVKYKLQDLTEPEEE